MKTLLDMPVSRTPAEFRNPRTVRVCTLPSAVTPPCVVASAFIDMLLMVKRAVLVGVITMLAVVCAAWKIVDDRFPELMVVRGFEPPIPNEKLPTETADAVTDTLYTVPTVRVMLVGTRVVAPFVVCCAVPPATVQVESKVQLVPEAPERAGASSGPSVEYATRLPPKELSAAPTFTPEAKACA